MATRFKRKAYGFEIKKSSLRVLMKLYLNI